MGWTRSGTVRVAIGAALLASASAAFADVLVVRALGSAATRLKPGTVLRDDARIVLRKNDTLVLLDERGTRTLRGPGNFSAQANANAPTPIVNRTPTWNERRRARIGAVRSIPAISASRPNLWMIDIATPGLACVVDPAAMTLWRSDSGAAGRTVITGPGGSAEIEWTSGQASQPWPATLGFTSGGSYRLNGVGTTGTGTAVTLKLLQPLPATVPDTGKALIDAKCSNQLDLLLLQIGEAGEREKS